MTHLRLLPILFLACLLGCPAQTEPAAAHYQSAAIAWIQENPTAAEAMFLEAEELGGAPKARAVALAAYGDYELRHGNTTEAHAHYEAARILDPNSAAALAGLGDAAAVAADYETAIVRYEEALKHEKRYAPAMGGLGLVSTILEEPEKAEEWFLKAIAPSATGFDPGVIEAYARFTETYPSYQPVFDTWLEPYLDEHPEDVRAHVIAGRYYQRTERTEWALESLGWAQEHRPDYPGLAEELGKLHFSQGHFVDAAKLFEHLHKTDPSADSLYLVAVAYANLPDYNNALALFEQGERDYPQEERFTIGVGQVFYQMGQYDRAYQKLLPLTEGGVAQFETYRELGLIEIARRNFGEAQRYLEEALAQAPFEAWVNFQLAYLAARNGDRDAFERHMPRVFEQGFVTDTALATFDNYEALMSVDWAAEWIAARRFTSKGDGPE